MVHPRACLTGQRLHNPRPAGSVPPVTGTPSREWGSLREDLDADVRRVTDRARNLSQARLAAPVGSHPSRAHAVRVVAQQLAEAAQGIAAREDPTEPGWRDLPVLSDLAVGDQLAVVGRDLIAELAGCEPAAAMWARGARRTAFDVVSAATEALATTRRLL